jgi:ribosomal protein S18 acetylase RimI-like enzyme
VLELRPFLQSKNVDQKVKIRPFVWSDFRSVKEMLCEAFSGFYASLGVGDSETVWRLYLRLRFQKILIRTKHCLTERSLKPLFTNMYDPIVIVAETRRNEVVGVAIVHNESKAVWKVVQVAVLSGYRRHGVGTALMKSILSLVKAKGGKRIALSVDIDNHLAIEFYRKFGFSVYAEEMHLDVRL